MGVPYAVGGGPVSFSRVGLALSERARPLRALRPRAGQAAQEAHRLGATDAPLGPTLVPRARDRCRGRPRLRSDLPVAPLRTLAREAHHLHHALAPGRGALRASPATQTTSDGPSTSQGSTPADLGGRRRRSEHHLGDHHASQLVRRSRKPRGAHRRGGLGDGRRSGTTRGCRRCPCAGC